ncbi:MAG: RNA methyltransferase [Candidatus Hydrogenedens sp.]|nr:RNA methyltransferase [Candidatus Hydrogenedentota bacterium]NLF57701.1 RNA methyltransferase [Candidatus Hydrogenedens sp.]
MPRDRNTKKQRFAGGHQRGWLWGRHAVMEALEAAHWPVVELYLDGTLPEDALGRARALGEAQGALCEVVPDRRLFELAHTHEHQGYLARMGPFPYTPLEEALSGGDGVKRPAGDAPLYLMLDAVQDTFNFGAILRSAEAMGVWAVIVGKTNQACVNSLVARASSGAINRIPVAEVDDLPAVAAELASRGVLVAAADEKSGVGCAGPDFCGPTALVLGNEGRGISPELMARCAARVRIPMFGAIGSLNVAAAAAVLLYEIRRQRGGGPPD